MLKQYNSGWSSEASDASHNHAPPISPALVGWKDATIAAQASGVRLRGTSLASLDHPELYCFSVQPPDTYHFIL